MKLTIKSLTGTNFTLDAEPTDTIGSVKAKIESAQGHPASAQKLIFSGKILTDDQTIEKCNIKSEKDFLVCMVSKPKAPKADAAAVAPSTPAPAASSASSATPAAPAPSSGSAAAPPATPATPSPASSTPAAAASAPATAAAAASSGPSSSFLSGAALESAIANMEEMGFAKPEIQRAMRASFNNPDRAIEYLMTGIPEGLGDAPAAPTSAATPASTTPSTTNASSAPAAAAAPAPAAPAAARSGNLFEAAAAAAQGGGAAGGGAAGTRGGIPGVEEDGQGGQTIDLGNPQMIEQLRTLLAQNPTALQPLIQAIAQSNPQLAQAMAQDPEGVLEMLAQGAEGGPGEGEALPSFEELSEEDRTAVQNISAMGIPVDQAIECYLMCGRNVEMAVQYYFDNPGDFQ